MRTLKNMQVLIVNCVCNKGINIISFCTLQSIDIANQNNNVTHI